MLVRVCYLRFPAPESVSFLFVIFAIIAGIAERNKTWRLVCMVAFPVCMMVCYKNRVFRFAFAPLACIVVPVKDIFSDVPACKLAILVVCSFRDGGLPSSCALSSCVSNDAVSTTIFVIGNILCAFSTIAKWDWILCSMLGASQPLRLLDIRLSNRFFL